MSEYTQKLWLKFIAYSLWVKKLDITFWIKWKKLKISKEQYVLSDKVIQKMS